MAIAITVVALTGCAGDGRTDSPTGGEAPPAVGATSTAASTTATADKDRDAAAAAFTRSLFAKFRSDEPGCTVAVGRDGQVVFAEAYGAARLDPLEPMTADTVVDIASVSKQFTATAILLLAERGAVDLDAPLSTYLPDLPAWASQPTVAELMHHESGIPDYLDLLVGRGFTLTGPSPTVADALDALGDVPELRFAPGTSWEYSNSNYFLLGQVVQAVSGEELGAFLATEVFEPLHLDMVMDPVAAIDEKAVSYELVDEEWHVADSHWVPTTGAGSIQTTPSQLVSWATQYWEPTVGASTIDAERFDGAVRTGRGMRYGAGIYLLDAGGDDGLILTHNGAWDGFRTVFTVLPERHAAVAVSCTSPTALGHIGHHNTFDRDLLTAWIGTD